MILETKSVRAVATALLAAVASAALSAETTPGMAAAAARAWARENASLAGGRREVRSVAAIRDDDGTPLWYEVSMEGGGGLVVSADTEVEPVVAAFDGCEGGIPKGHPLHALLLRDMRSRLASVDGSAPAAVKAADKAAAGGAGATAGGTGGARDARARAKRKWERLAGSGAAAEPGGAKMAVSPSGEVLPDRIWSYLYGWSSHELDHWNQNGWNRYVDLPTLYDRYTPDHDPCGCVATAGASLLQFFRVSRAPAATRDCSVDGLPVELATKGTAYDWSLLDPVRWEGGPTLTRAQQDLLGRVTYDVGVCIGTGYWEDGSAASVRDLAQSLREDFGLAQARWTSEVTPACFEKLIYNPVRSGLPVVLGIYGWGSHAVVAVGYGEDDSGTAYTRIFMGWGGTGDAWYALPNVDDYRAVDDAITLIGDSSRVVPICVRVTTPSGDGVAFEPVLVNGREAGRTTADGFFATTVPTNAATYAVSCRGRSATATVGEGLGVAYDWLFAEEAAELLPDTIRLTVEPAASELKVYHSPVEARAAALALGRPLFVLSGADWCGYCGIVKNYLKGLGSAFADRFVFYYCNIDNDAWGMALGAPDYGVFDPRPFHHSRGWSEDNGLLADDGGGVEERVQAVLDKGWAAWRGRAAAPAKVRISGPGFAYRATRYSVAATFPDGTVADLSDGATWTRVSGTAATLSATGVLRPVSGATGTVVVRGTAVLWGQTYTRTLAVKILRPSTPYKVKFNANGGKGKMAVQKMKYGKAAKLRRNAFVRDGWIFAGWAVKGKGPVAYADAAKVKDVGGGATARTLYAIWARPTYKVKFLANGGKGKMAVQAFRYGQAQKLSANKFKRKGYVFKGWARTKADAKAGKAAFKNKKAVKNLTTTGKTVKLYAVWKKKK